MKASDFEKKFDEGNEDIVDDLDLSQARRFNEKHKRVYLSKCYAQTPCD